jgi:methylmalonyl-CoA/ethylmalonyl-CoA epimerase
MWIRGVEANAAKAFEIKFHHGGISVPDLEASIEWWANMLNFVEEQRIYIDAIPAKVAIIRRGDLRIELFEAEKATPLPGDRRYPNKDVLTHGNKHIAFAVRDARAAAEELRSKGADVVFIMDFPWGSNAFIRDNAGNLIELVTQPDMY